MSFRSSLLHARLRAKMWGAWIRFTSKQRCCNLEYTKRRLQAAWMVMRRGQPACAAKQFSARRVRMVNRIWSIAGLL
eukprot:351666-Chlamydomonas_euryale.AAC.3